MLFVLALILEACREHSYEELHDRNISFFVH